MANALAYIGGGLLAGVGEGMVMEGKARREEIMKRLDREFQAGENEKNRQLTRDEGAESRRVTQEEGGATRENARDLQAESLRVTQEEGGATRENARTLSAAQIQATKDEGKANRDHALGLLKTKADIDKAAIAGHLDKAEVGADGNYVLFMKDGTIKKTDVKGVAKGETASPVKIYDPNSPTGESYTTPSGAVGKASPPASGMSFTSDGKGGFELTQGKPGANGITTKTKGDIEEKQFNAGERMARLDAIQQKFKPEYLQLKPRGKAAWSSAKDFMGIDLGPEESEKLTEYTQFRQDATKNLNQEIKDITGSAMGVQEAERIIATMPNAGTGILDGDSPTVFKAKADNVIAQTRNAMIRYSYAKNNGLDPMKTGIEIQDVPKLVEARGAAIEKEIREANPGAADSAIKLALRERLRVEFGIR